MRIRTRLLVACVIALLFVVYKYDRSIDWDEAPVISLMQREEQRIEEVKSASTLKLTLVQAVEATQHAQQAFEQADAALNIAMKKAHLREVIRKDDGEIVMEKHEREADKFAVAFRVQNEHSEVYTAACAAAVHSGHGTDVQIRRACAGRSGIK
jgi:hypothetical protein